MADDARLKQVIVMRTDLNMRRGKQIAQGAHASMEFLRRMHVEGRPCPTHEQTMWMYGDHTKICVGVESLGQLEEIVSLAKQRCVEVHVVTDLGKTEFGGVETTTCAAIGPHDARVIDEITGHLRLL